jgi:hypothetical protein
LKTKNEGEGKLRFHYHYPEPFGTFTDSCGTEEFPQFDFDCPSIIRQNSNAYDCGLAVVANSMGFVKHLKSVKFRKSDMTRNEGRQVTSGKVLYKVRFYLREKIYSLQVFWDKVLTDSNQQRYPGDIKRAEGLMKFMRAEYIEILDEIACASVADVTSFRTLQENITQTTLPNTPNTQATLPNTAKTLKSNENEMTMSPAPNVHVSTIILDQFKDMFERQQTPHVSCCEQCNVCKMESVFWINVLINAINAVFFRYQVLKLSQISLEDTHQPHYEMIPFSRSILVITSEF